MKRHLLRFTAACVVLTASSIPALGEKVMPGKVPMAVMKAIGEESKLSGEPAKEIEREVKDGRVVYDVEFTRKGINKHVKFNEDGTLSGARGVTDASASPALERLPEPVQKTLEQNRGERVVAHMDEENWNGKTVYEIEFREKGPNSRIYIASDGTLIRNDDREQNRFKGMALSETPQAVRDKVKEVAGDAEVARITDKKQAGQVLYKVDIRQQGKDRRLIIADNGTLVRDSEAGDTVPGESTVERVREKVHELFGGKTVSLGQTPDAVQQTIKDNTAAGTLKSIKSEEKNGVTSYIAEFETAGKNAHLRIAEDGRILEENRR